ncbi:hypothetical protein NC653_001901 [Populus alba x Populus x berolinensis]|uniref:Cytochrome c oxidase subunit Vb n=1 Tax=Populus alba x Populus x berolinensis TaxID=444605 RepID=A0AAD6RMR2_9ROSI|nr:hypothetical protein NC653_001901 [Populus alba x Populus x berolinensis]
MWRRLASSHLRTLVTTTSARSTQSLLLNRSIIIPSPSTSLFNRYFSADSVNGAVKKRVEDVMPIATGHEREELEAELEGKKLLDIDYPDGPFGTKHGSCVEVSEIVPRAESLDLSVKVAGVMFWGSRWFGGRYDGIDSGGADQGGYGKSFKIIPIPCEKPAVIKSYYDRRIVGCPGGEGEDEHDVVWFWLEKGKPHECPVCTQNFVLEVVGPGGPPDGHGDDDDHHH